ncbi:MAG: hypothetical protein IKX24_00805 [Prevotella sp.]|nr:hypothetical protein [Prevotella sp.]
MIIAVDFDGTIVDHQYPKIGAERPHATEVLRKLMDDGHKLILWTVREGPLLEEAINWCMERGVQFSSINESIYTDHREHAPSRKLHADIFIDDCNIGGPWDWDLVYHMIHDNLSYRAVLREIRNQSKQQSAAQETPKKKRRWFGF